MEKEEVSHAQKRYRTEELIAKLGEAERPGSSPHAVAPADTDGATKRPATAHLNESPL